MPVPPDAHPAATCHHAVPADRAPAPRTPPAPDIGHRRPTGTGEAGR